MELRNSSVQELIILVEDILIESNLEIVFAEWDDCTVQKYHVWQYNAKVGFVCESPYVPEFQKNCNSTT